MFGLTSTRSLRENLKGSQSFMDGWITFTEAPTAGTIMCL